MKRCYIGGGLLVVLCLVCGGLSCAMRAIHAPLSVQLLHARMQTMEGDLSQGKRSASLARADWEKWKLFRACVTDHTPVEAIDAGFAELESYGTSGEDAAFAAKSAELAQMVKALAESQSLTWWNLF